MFFPALSLSGKERLVVICHQHRHTTLFRISDLLDRRDSIVTGQDRIYALLHRIAQQVDVQAISVLHPVRDLIIYNSPTPTQCTVQNVRGINSVDIIVSDDPDFFLFCDFIFQNLRCLGAALQTGRVAKPDK